MSSLQQPSLGRRAATDAIAGAGAGAFAKTLAAPLDRVKLLTQLRGSIVVSKDNSQSSVAQSQSAWQFCKAIIREEGFVSFWRGNSATIVIQAGTSALNFLFLDQFKVATKSALEQSSDRYPWLHGEDNSRKRRLISSFVSGGLAGAATITFLYPLGFMRTRLAMDVGSAARNERLYPNGMRDVAKSIWRTDGFTGFYRGYAIALASVTLYRVVYLGGYDYLKSEIKIADDDARRNNKESTVTSTEHTPVIQRFLAAQFVSMMASIVHYPLDSIRRRLMMEAGKTQQERMYHGAMHCCSRIASEEGFRGFYRGLGVNLVRSVSAALVLISYDEFKRMLS